MTTESFRRRLPAGIVLLALLLAYAGADRPLRAAVYGSAEQADLESLKPMLEKLPEPIAEPIRRQLRIHDLQQKLPKLEGKERQKALFALATLCRSPQRRRGLLRILIAEYPDSPKTIEAWTQLASSGGEPRSAMVAEYIAFATGLHARKERWGQKAWVNGWNMFRHLSPAEKRPFLEAVAGHQIVADELVFAYEELADMAIAEGNAELRRQTEECLRKCRDEAEKRRQNQRKGRK